MSQRVPTKVTVTVWDKDYEVIVVQRSKTVWEVVGTYEGHHISVKGSSESSALAHWRDAAQYQGNL